MNSKLLDELRRASELQLASEALLYRANSSGEVVSILENGNSAGAVLPHVDIQDFSYNGRYVLVSHIDQNLGRTRYPEGSAASGFSASLFYDKALDEYTLSIRGTEFSSEIRDLGDIAADFEIISYGFAYGQIHTMQNYWKYLVGDSQTSPPGVISVAPDYLSNFRNEHLNGKKISVTGYSLGGHLAAVFESLNSDSVNKVYQFNGAGLGAINEVSNLTELYESYVEARQAVSSDQGVFFQQVSDFISSVVGVLTVEDLNLGSVYREIEHQAALLQIHHYSSDILYSSNILPRDAIRDSISDQNIYDVWASTGKAESFLETIVARSGIRSGKAVPIWHEEQPIAYFDDFSEPGGRPFLTGHSLSILYDSLALMATFEELDPEITTARLEKYLSQSSSVMHESLEGTVNHLSRLLGIVPLGLSEIVQQQSQVLDPEFRNHFHNKLSEIEEAPLFQSLRESGVSILPSDTTTIAESAQENFSHFLALEFLSPFYIHTLESSGELALAETHADLHATWDSDQHLSQSDIARGDVYFSARYYDDRAKYLQSFQYANETDTQYGNLAKPVRFIDIANNRSLIGDAQVPVTQQNGHLAFGPVFDESERVQVAFGSADGDIISVTSENDDTLYGLGGNDALLAGGGNDHLEGGHGNDWLVGQEGDDTLISGMGDDLLVGGKGSDLLVGGAGEDTFYWSDGDGEDLIADFDDGGDRIVVNGLDLSSLTFRQISPGGSIYGNSDHPDIQLRYSGAELVVQIGSIADQQGIVLSYFSSATGRNYGIELTPYEQPTLEAADVSVSRLGSGHSETEPLAWYRLASQQADIDWESSTLHLDANELENYSGAGVLHGVYRGAFEGGPNNDVLIGGFGQDAYYGLSGDDYIVGGLGDDSLEGGPGSDTILGGPGGDLLFGSSPIDAAEKLSHDSPASVYLRQHLFDADNDVNILDGGEGNDFIAGGKQRDQATGAEGDDYLFGGQGEDQLQGGGGADILYGDSSFIHDVYVAEDEITLFERIKVSWLAGESVAGDFDDLIEGGSGSDTLWGELGSDTLYGGEGDDRLFGDRHQHTSPFLSLDGSTAELPLVLHAADRLYGGPGNDTLNGHGGNDWLAGGPGIDFLYGESGDDIYYFRPGDGVNLIEDNDGEHVFVFSNEMTTDDLEIVFRNNAVRVGPKESVEGLYVDRGEWNNVTIALGDVQSKVERSRIDTSYLDRSGNPLLGIAGIDTLTEAQRNDLLAIDDTNTEAPTFLIGPDVSSIRVGPSLQDTRVVQAHLGFDLLGWGLELAVSLPPEDIDKLSAYNDLAHLISGFSGEIVGTPNDDHVVGSHDDDIISGLAGNDSIAAGDGADRVSAGSGNDQLFGEAGADRLLGQSGSDWLIGGQGDDYLDGGYGNDTYFFEAGDGEDTLVDEEGAITFSFGSTVLPTSIYLTYTGETSGQFRINYAEGSINSDGSASVHRIHDVFSAHGKLPLLQRSELFNGHFFDSRSNDIFEPGSGNDTIYAAGWGDDVYRLDESAGDDTIVLDSGTFIPEPMGEVRFTAEPGVFRPTFDGRQALVDHKGGQLRISPTSGNAYDNGLLRLELTVEGAPDWRPIIGTSPGLQGVLYGTFGSDIIFGDIRNNTIVPGYGNDVIFGGSGHETLLLDKTYMYPTYGGIGHKHISLGAGNDRVVTPLAQGLSYYFQLGDGYDTIEYNWTFSGLEPYSFDMDYDNASVTFEPNGDDKLVFGQGISLEDLTFVKNGENLTINVSGADQSIDIIHFFAADVEAPSSPSVVQELLSESIPDNALERLHKLGLIPKYPIDRIEFENGTSVAMEDALSAKLIDPEIIMNVIRGTSEDDVLIGQTEENDQIIGLAGDDTISDLGGINSIEAGPGNDTITLAGENSLNAGSGNDIITITAGSSRVTPDSGDDIVGFMSGQHTMTFGTGDGQDFVVIMAENTELVLELDAGIGRSDIWIDFDKNQPQSFLANTSQGQFVLEVSGFIRVGLVGSSDFVTLSPSRFDPNYGAIMPTAANTFHEIRFADGTVMTEAEILEAAGGDLRMTITGSDGSDFIPGSFEDDHVVGGPGDDDLQGLEGNDIFIVTGTDDGADIIDGGDGFDIIFGSPGWDRITLREFLPQHSIERIDGAGGGFNFVAGTESHNRLDFSATELIDILGINGYGGNDTITGSESGEIIIGGRGDDTLNGKGGDDTYFFSPGDGNDLIINNHVDSDDIDTLSFKEIEKDDLWFSRSGDDLLIQVVGTDDQVTIDDWYVSDLSRLDIIESRASTLVMNQLDSLVTAMSQFDIPLGVGADIPTVVYDQLEPVIANSWQAAS